MSRALHMTELNFFNTQSRLKVEEEGFLPTIEQRDASEIVKRKIKQKDKAKEIPDIDV